MWSSGTAAKGAACRVGKGPGLVRTEDRTGERRRMVHADWPGLESEAVRLFPSYQGPCLPYRPPDGLAGDASLCCRTARCTGHQTRGHHIELSIFFVRSRAVLSIVIHDTPKLLVGAPLIFGGRAVGHKQDMDSRALGVEEAEPRPDQIIKVCVRIHVPICMYSVLLLTPRIRGFSSSQRPIDGSHQNKHNNGRQCVAVLFEKQAGSSPQLRWVIMAQYGFWIPTSKPSVSPEDLTVRNTHSVLRTVRPSHKMQRVIGCGSPRILESLSARLHSDIHIHLHQQCRRM